MIISRTPDWAFAYDEDRLGRLWITDHEEHTAYWQNGRATPFEGVSTHSTFRVVEDSEGSNIDPSYSANLWDAPLRWTRGLSELVRLSTTVEKARAAAWQQTVSNR